jgi:hypothetical protein
MIVLYEVAQKRRFFTGAGHTTHTCRPQGRVGTKLNYNAMQRIYSERACVVLNVCSGTTEN